MTTKTAKKEAPKQRTTQKAEDLFEPVAKTLREAGSEGLTLAQVSELTNVRPRVLHNVLYRMEQAGKVRKVKEQGKRIHYVSTEAKATRRRTRKPAAPKQPATKPEATEATAAA